MLIHRPFGHNHKARGRHGLPRPVHPVCHLGLERDRDRGFHDVDDVARGYGQARDGLVVQRHHEDAGGGIGLDALQGFRGGLAGAKVQPFDSDSCEGAEEIGLYDDVIFGEDNGLNSTTKRTVRSLRILWLRIQFVPCSADPARAGQRYAVP